MEIRAYNETYLSHAMENLAAMLDYGINGCGIPAQLFFSRFITSGVAKQFENGNPDFLVGHSGHELAEMVIERSGGGSCAKTVRNDSYERSPEYWAGWVLAYYQWKRCRSFAQMQKYGLDISKVVAMYHPLHEADVEKFVDIAESIISENCSKVNPLKDARKRMNMTQKNLALTSGVSLRMIRAYEQKQQDLSKAEYGTVTRLAKVLMVPIE